MQDVDEYEADLRRNAMPTGYVTIALYAILIAGGFVCDFLYARALLP